VEYLFSFWNLFSKEKKKCLTRSQFWESGDAKTFFSENFLNFKFFNQSTGTKKKKGFQKKSKSFF
jgi:hypothetical protein